MELKASLVLRSRGAVSAGNSPTQPEGSSVEPRRLRRSFRPACLSITGAVGRRGGPGLEGRGFGCPVERGFQASRRDWWAALTAVDVDEGFWGRPLRRWNPRGGITQDRNAAWLGGCRERGWRKRWGKLRTECGGFLCFTVCSLSIESKSKPTSGSLRALLVLPKSSKLQVLNIY